MFWGLLVPGFLVPDTQNSVRIAHLLELCLTMSYYGFSRCFIGVLSATYGHYSTALQVLQVKTACSKMN
jgi:hypothetical protein